MQTDRSAKHTPTPWTTEGEGPHVLARTANGLCLANDNESIAVVHGPDAEANRRRIVQCVNACAEDGPVMDLARHVLKTADPHSPFGIRALAVLRALGAQP